MASRTVTPPISSRPPRSQTSSDVLELELSRYLLMKVAKILRRDYLADGEWIMREYVKPSYDWGKAISATSNSEEYQRLQELCALAMEIDAAVIKRAGPLILKATKSGVEQPAPIDMSATKQSEQNDTSATAFQNNYDGNGKTVHNTTAGGMLNKPSSPKPISPPSDFRSTSSEASGGAMAFAPSHVVPKTARHASVDVGQDSSSLSMPQDAPIAMGTPSRARITRSPVSQVEREHHYSSSTVCESPNTTVSFNAVITTPHTVVEVPFTLENASQTVDDILAYVDWKNSEHGRDVAVDLATFLSIMRYTPRPSNALVLRRGSDEA